MIFLSQFFEVIVRELCNSNDFEFIDDRPIIAQLIKNDNSNIQFEISKLKVKIMDYQEQKTNFLEKKDYDSSQKVTEKMNIARMEYNNFLIPILNSLPENEAKMVSWKILSKITLIFVLITLYFYSTNYQSSIRKNNR